MQKYDLLASFKDTELNLMINHINKLTSNAISASDIYTFISNCIYLKKYVNEKLNINLEFGPDQLRRIESFCEAIKAYQLFNSNSKRLSENPAVKAQKSEIDTIQSVMSRYCDDRNIKAKLAKDEKVTMLLQQAKSLIATLRTLIR
jgi:hypothetical protein